jgi:N-acetylglucosamine-6-phosphate deacetylase
MSDFTLSGPTLLAGGAIVPATIAIQGGRIARILPGLDMTADLVVEGVIAPGLLDLQLNGGFGYDFTTDGRTVAEVAARVPAYGVTGFLATVITSPQETYPRRLAQIAEAADAAPGARVLGVHFEGPYLSSRRKGAHDSSLFRAADAAEIARWASHPLVRMVTLAPELPGALAAVRQLRAVGVVVSAGHSDATFEQGMAALDAGVNMCTHLFNAMPELRQRAPGLAGAFLTVSTPCGIIADGAHVHPAMLRLAIQMKGASGIALVTDAMAAIGMPPGRYHLGDREVSVDGAVSRLVDGTLAGSILTMDLAVRNVVELAGCTPAQALTMASRTPARVVGLGKQGRLEAGCDADIAVFDASLHVTHTFVRGRLAFEAPRAPPVRS